jgi:hypothetical protein
MISFVKRNFVILGIFILLLIPISSEAASYYMRADGTAANKEEATSCSNVTTAMSVSVHNSETFSPGDVIYFCDGGGVYRSGGNGVNVPSSGLPGNPIVYQPAPGNHPIFNGANLLSGWKNEGNNIWSTSLFGGQVTRLAFFNGVRGQLKTSANELANEKDWYYDNSLHRFYIYSQSDPSVVYTSPGIEATIQAWSFYVDNRSNIIISGDISIVHGLFCVYALGATNFIADGLTIKQCAGGIIVGRGSSNVEIKNNKISEMYHMPNSEDGAGINFSGTDNPNFSVHHNLLSNIGGYGIGFNSSQQTGGSVYNNILNGVANDPTSPEPHGMLIKNNTSVYGNEIVNSGSLNNPSVGIQIYGNGNKVYRNLIHDNFGIGLQALGVNTNVIINNNIIYRNQGDGVYLQSNGSTLRSQFLNNTLYNNCLSKGLANLVLYNLDYMDIKNNIISDSGCSYEFYVGANTSNQDVDYNLYYHPNGTNYFYIGGKASDYSYWKAYGINPPNDSHSPNPSNPFFVNPSIGDFHLLSSSPAVNSGTDVGITIDYEGNAVPQVGISDIGTYESQYGSIVADINQSLPVPTISSFLVSPTSINKGSSATLSWQVSNAASVIIDQGIGVVTGTSITVSPQANTTYTITATSGSSSVTKSVNIIVNQTTINTSTTSTSTNQNNANAVNNTNTTPVSNVAGGISIKPTQYISLKIKQWVDTYNTCPTSQFNSTEFGECMRYYLNKDVFNWDTNQIQKTTSTSTNSTVPVQQVSNGGVVLTRKLYIGLKGPDVMALQNFLINNKYLGSGNKTGYYGQLTRSAVRAYQCQKLSICSGSESTNGYGLVGVKTRAMLLSGK